MLKIAVACEKDKVSGHFGHCEHYALYTTEDDQIIQQVSLPNPGHKPGFLPKYLYEQGIHVIISGGMGGAAVQLFNKYDIQVVIGTKGLAKEAVERYLRNELQSTGSVCHEHAHEDQCHS